MDGVLQPPDLRTVAMPEMALNSILSLLMSLLLEVICRFQRPPAERLLDPGLDQPGSFYYWPQTFR